MSEPFDPYRKWLGIPPAEQPPHHYRLLGIAALEDDPDVIDNAANRQMAHVRTFQHGPHAAISQRLLTELSAAKLCLLTPERKAEYDAQLRELLSPAVPRQPPDVAPFFAGVRRAGRPIEALFPREPASMPAPGLPPGGADAESRPVVRGVSSSHLTKTAKARQRRPVLPIALTVISMVVLASVGVIIFLFGNPLQDRAESKQQDKTSVGEPEAQKTDSATTALPVNEKSK